jgi:hypothetical protein
MRLSFRNVALKYSHLMCDVHKRYMLENLDSKDHIRLVMDYAGWCPDCRCNSRNLRYIMIKKYHDSV